MKLILKNGMSVLYKNGMSLTGLNIDSIVAESKEDRADLRMLLMGTLKVDEDGCHQLGRGFGSNALATNPDVSNGNVPLGNDLSKGAEVKLDYSLEEKLKIIDTLTSALKRENSVFYEHTKETEGKLLALIRSI
ncbi:hypothetical protein J559_2865 [Acinetobacter sp. 983759]|uniref:hypothetical protein n=1 Tax=Acinetobacter sp. 983759 TaxID=1310660 RepID=UPI00044A3303|nr:hypothetical protein [Acinetobacter sp. 983759]EXE12876.1 hypothetical protein J559_2865 [Acinetobacter sp. 983759]